MPIEIQFVDEQILRPMTDAELQRVRTVLTQVLIDHEVVDAEISVAILDDSTIREYNRRYLDHDWETDVISFLLSEEDQQLEGQLLISRQTADTVAAELPWSGDDELLLYAIHGTLHLLGYDDDVAEHVEVMRLHERKYLELAGVPRADEHPHFAERAKFTDVDGGQLDDA